LHWQKQRELLTKMAKVSDSEITQGNKAFSDLMEQLASQKKTIDEHRKALAAKKKSLEAELQEIPTRIAEVNRNLPEEPDYYAIEKEIAALMEKITARPTSATHRVRKTPC